MSEHRKKRSSGALRTRQGTAEIDNLDRSPQAQSQYPNSQQNQRRDRGKMNHSHAHGKGGPTRQTSYDQVRKIVQREGRTARNLITWSVPVESYDYGATRVIVPKSSNTRTKTWHVRSNSASSKLPVAPSGRSRDSTPPADVKKSSVEARRSGAATTTPKKAASLRARYWAFLFDNLERAVDMIYQTCETDESVVECKEAIMRLEQCTKDFQSLIQRFNLLRVYETAEEGHKPTSLAWDVRKSSPVKSMTGGGAPKPFPHGVSPASRSLDFCPTKNNTRGLQAGGGGSWADRVRGGPEGPSDLGGGGTDLPLCAPCGDGATDGQTRPRQSGPELDAGDADGWRTVHHGRRSATHQGLARGANSDESDDSEKENWPSDGRPSGEARLTSDRPTSGSQPTGETTPTSDGKSSGELRLTAGGKPPGEMDLTSDSRPSGEVRQTSGGQPSDGKPPGEMDLTSDSQPSGEVRQTSGGQPSGGQLSGETYPTSDGQPSGEMDLTSDSQPSGDVRPMSDSPASGDAKLTSDSQSSGESRLTSDGQPDGPYPVATDTGGTYDLHNNSSDARDGDTEDEELATSLESMRTEALVCALDDEDDRSSVLEARQERALESAIEQEQTYLEEIAREQRTTIEVDDDDDDDDDAGGSGGSGGARAIDGIDKGSNSESPQPTVEKEVDTEGAEKRPRPKLWSEIMEEAENSWIPGHGLHMHEKLSSPSRKRSLNEKKRRHEEKQAKAAELREKLQGEKAERLRLLTSKVEEVRNWKDELLRQRRDMIEEKLRRAEQKRLLQLQMKIRKAHEEETKANEIAFINILEAQNKRHDIMSKHQESEARLLDIQEERQRKCGEKAAKEAAAEERRRALQAGRSARLQEMADRQRQREADFEQRQHVREKHRIETARTRELEHEERLAVLNARQQEHVIQLQRKIQQRQDESDRRHKEKLDSIREKAFEMSVLRHSTEDHNEAPEMVPYETKKFCVACRVMIPSEVYLLGHLRGKRHQQALMESNGGKGLSKEQIETFNLAHISDAPPDAPDPLVILHRERLKTQRKRCKKLRQRMALRGAEYETALNSKQQLVDSPQRAKIQKLAKDLTKYVNCADSGPWPPSRVSALDRSTGELIRILDKKVLAEQNTLRVSGAMTSLGRLLLVITQTTPGGATIIPNKSLLNVCTVLRLSCKGCYDNCHYMLFTNKIGFLVDQLVHRFDHVGCPADGGASGAVAGGTGGAGGGPVAGRAALDAVTGGLVQLVGTVLACLARQNPGANASVASAVRTAASGDAFMSRANDIISYVISAGLLDRLTSCLASVRGPMKTDGREADFLLHILGLITAMIGIVACRKTGVFERCPPDATQLLQTLRVTDLVGIVSLMYSVLLHSGAPPRGDTPPPQLPGPTHAVVAAALRMLNHLAVLDLPLLQGSMGEEATSLEFRHIASYLLWYCAHWPSSELLHEVVLCIGYFTVNSGDNQLFIQSGQPPTVLQQLCALPFPYFSIPRLSAVLFPTLIACCYGSQRNKEIIQQELSCTLLAKFIEERSLEAQSKTTSSGNLKNKSPDKDFDGRMSLSYRLPPDDWAKAQAYFQ